jgi:serine/threonine protein kinase
MIENFKGFVPKYTFQKLIGSGSFGSVYKAKDNLTGLTVAIKRTTKKGTIISREYKILKEISGCENIVKLQEIFYTYSDKNIIQNLVFEYFPMNLSKYIRDRYSNSRLSYIEIAKIMKQILNGLDYLHENGIMHRDLKPENILIDPESLCIKLCDFGCAKRVGGVDNTPYIVSRYYRAPELVYGTHIYSTEIDIWAAGCILMELCIGKPVFMGKDDGDQFIQQAYTLGPPSLYEFTKLIENSEISAKLVTKALIIKSKTSINTLLKETEHAVHIENLVKTMLCYDPAKRTTAKNALSHFFFNI